MTVTWPDGIGRERVRSTLPSRSRSTMSFQVQPAPRIAKAPMKNSTTCQRFGPAVRRATGKPGRPPARHQQQPGADRPVERARAADRAAARRARARSTQLPVESATRPAASLIAASGLPVSVSKVPAPLFVTAVRARPAWCRARRSGSGRSARGPRGGVADLLGDLAAPWRGWPCTCCDDLGGMPHRLGRSSSSTLIILRLGGDEGLEQPAGFLRAALSSRWRPQMPTPRFCASSRSARSS